MKAEEVLKRVKAREKRVTRGRQRSGRTWQKQLAGLEALLKGRARPVRGQGDVAARLKRLKAKIARARGG